MSLLEDQLKKYAIYSAGPGSLKDAPLTKMLSHYEKEPLSMGYNTRVFKLPEEGWVIKEGRWDLDIGLFGNVKMEIPAQPFENLLNLFELSFLPNPEEILRQYELYLKFIQYFGYFSKEEDYYHPEIESIRTKQKSIRDSLVEFIPDVEKKFNFKIESKIKNILESDMKYINFLPKEYLLYGESFSKENQNKKTYYIFQEFVKGKLLHDVSKEEVENTVVGQLALLLYMLLVMNMKEELLPDTRPRHVVQAFDWLTKTDNIIIADDSVKFIDTRWLWDTSSGLVKRGMMIPDMTIKMSKKYLNYYLKKIG